MSYSLSHLPSSLRNSARQLAEFLREQSRLGAVSWTINPEECFEQYGFIWAAERRYCSLEVAIDQRKGKVWKFTIELPDKWALHTDS